MSLVDSAGQAIGIAAAGLLTPAPGLMTMPETKAALYLAAGALAARWLEARR